MVAHLQSLRHSGRAAAVGILPLRLPSGAAAGMVINEPGALASLLAWEGRRLWLDPAPVRRDWLQRLERLLADGSLQVLLRRRPGEEPGAPAVVQVMLAVHGRDPRALGRRIVAALAALPGQLRPLGPAETATWLRTWHEATAWPSITPSESAAPQVVDLPAPAIMDTAIRTPEGRSVRLLAATGLPTMLDADWVSHVLTGSSRAANMLDVVIHARPDPQTAQERRIAGARLAALERALTRLQRAGRSPAAPAWRRLIAEREALLARARSRGAGGSERCRISLTVAVHGRGEPAEPAVEPGVAALQDLGLRLHVIQGRARLRRQWELLRPGIAAPVARTPLPALTIEEAAPLLWLAVAPRQAPTGADTPTVAVDDTSVGWPLAARPAHLLATGAPGPARDVMLQAWARVHAAAGVPVIVLDASGAWPGASTGVHGRLTPRSPTEDPLAGRPAPHLVSDWAGWLAASERALAGLIPPFDDQAWGAVRATLLEVALAHLERGRPLTTQEVVARLHAGGYAALARALAVALARTVHWAGPSALEWRPGLTVATWDGPEAGWGRGLADTALALLDAWLERTGSSTPALLIVHDDGRALADRWATEALIMVARRGEHMGLRLWVVAGSASQAARVAGTRALGHCLSTRLATADPTAMPSDLTELGWSDEVARLVPDLPPGVAALRDGTGAALVRLSGRAAEAVQRAAEHVKTALMASA